MAVARFEGDGPVARYWLARCEGFAVQGDARGTVEELLRDGDPHVTTRLLVRTGRGRTRIIPAAAVTSVVPEERVLVVSRPRPARPPRQLPDVRKPARQAIVVSRPVLARTVAASRPVLHRVRDEAWTYVRPAWLMLVDSLRILRAEFARSFRSLVRDLRT